MSLLLALLTPAALGLGGWLNPPAARPAPMHYGAFLLLLARIASRPGCWWPCSCGWRCAFRQLRAGACAGHRRHLLRGGRHLGAHRRVLPWQIPVNQLASDPARADLALLVGLIGGALACGWLLRDLARREVL
jgi:lantibiotic transport system permease protein